MKIIEETPYRFRIEQEGAMRVPGIVFASRSLLPEKHRDMAPAQGGQSGHTAGDRPGVVCDAGCALGVRVSDRRRGSHHIDAAGVIFPRWGRLRHFVRGTAAGYR